MHKGAILLIHQKLLSLKQMCLKMIINQINSRQILHPLKLLFMLKINLKVQNINRQLLL